MTDQQPTVAEADAAGTNFAKAFLPGLVLGLVIGLFIGAWLPPFFGEKSDLVQTDRTGVTPTPREGESTNSPESEQPAQEQAPAAEPEPGSTGDSAGSGASDNPG